MSQLTATRYRLSREGKAWCGERHEREVETESAEQTVQTEQVGRHSWLGMSSLA